MDGIAKQKLNVIMVVDCSTSMRGGRIKQVNDAIRSVSCHLAKMQEENSNVDFALTVITYSTDACFWGGEISKGVNDFDFLDIRAGGWSNLHLAYAKLEDILEKQSRGGIMPDFGGVAPILLLMTDGHPTKFPLKEEMAKLRKKPWFKAALKYGIAIQLDDKRTMDVLEDFVSGNGDVVQCCDSNFLEKIIKIIVLTASKVKSSSVSVHAGAPLSVANEVKQQIQKALTEVDDWEW